MLSRKLIAGAAVKIEGLAAWYDASSIMGVSNGSALAAWPDVSGNGRTATAAGTTPTYETNVLNGQPTVRGAGAGYFTASLGSGAMPGTVFVVGKQTGTGHRAFCGGQSIADGYSLDAWYFKANNPKGRAQAIVGAESNTWQGTCEPHTADTTAFHIYAAAFDPATVRGRLWMDGGLYGSQAHPSLTAKTSTGTIALFTDYYSQAIADTMIGDIAEILIYDRELSLSEMDRVGSYLAGKYALSWTSTESAAFTPPTSFVETMHIDPVTGVTTGAGAEQVLLRYTNDGKTYTPASIASFTCPLISNTPRARDPSVMKHPTDGHWYVAYTNADNSGFPTESTFGLARTSNWADWEWLGDIAVPISGVTNVYAPEWFVDSDSSIHLLMSVSTNNLSTLAIYEMHPTDSTMVNYSAPVLVTGTSLPSVMYDPFVVKVGSTYYLWYGDGTYLCMATSSSLTSGYTIVHSGNFASWWDGNHALEGAAVFIPTPGTYRIVFTNSAQPSYWADSTDTMSTFTSATDLSPSTYVHGTIIPYP